MSAPRPDHPKSIELLRAYILGTLSASKRQRVEQYIAEYDAWHVALEKVREQLAILDRLPAASPSHDLVEDVVTAVAREGEERSKQVKTRFSGVWKLALTASMFLIVAAMLLPSLARVREAARKASSANNLKQMGLIFKMYSNEHRGQYPPLTRYPDLWMVDFETIYPEYLNDMNILINPDLPNRWDLVEEMQRLIAQKPVDWEAVTRLAAISYTYTPWALKSAEDARIAKSMAEKAWQKENGRILIAAREELEKESIYLLREGVERFFITDINNPAGSAQAQSDVPVMFENLAHVGLRDPAGANVLYMDGHVELIPASQDTYPVTEETATIFQSDAPPLPKPPAIGHTRMYQMALFCAAVLGIAAVLIWSYRSKRKSDG